MAEVSEISTIRAVCYSVYPWAGDCFNETNCYFPGIEVELFKKVASVLGYDVQFTIAGMKGFS